MKPLLIVGGCLVFAYNSCGTADREPAKTSTTALTPPIATSVPLEIQERCAADALKYVKDAGLNLGPNSMDGYRSHFNSVLGRCFVELHSLSHPASDKDLIQTSQVADANDGDLFAEYGSKFGVSPISCRVALDTGQFQACTSWDEWEMGTNRLMQRPEGWGRMLPPKPQ